MNSNRSLTKRILVLVIALLVVVLVIAVASPVIAYYIRSTEKIEGTYEPGKPSKPGMTQPVQTQRISFLSDTETSLENLYIQIPDQGYPVYVRAAVVVNWLKPADCTCAESRCNTHGCICADCEEDCDPNCEKCDDNCAGNQNTTGCKECPNCEGDCKDCNGCIDCNGCGGVIECEDCGEDCPECKEGACEDCTKSCTGCTNCRKKGEHCTECTNCKGKVCLDCEDCPRCNEDDSDDWDIIFPQPTADGENPDYTLEIGGEKDSIWKKLDNSGFYYHKTSVTSGGNATGGLITLDRDSAPFLKKFERLATAKLPIDVAGLDVKDCILRVEIIVQTVQAIGSTDEIGDLATDNTAAWQDAWGEGLTEGPDKWPNKG